ncbi:inactive peptidyl-prolyl cis-trans isomerase FKBP6-like [Liolophura sinensis]|uniref:inactive peptidyl-prolyl cis-trans isomerase FKBP6-like n=1 Tax=Liolophura sinensis TaxID=3198878 RepID=UPI003158DAD8
MATAAGSHRLNDGISLRDVLHGEGAEFEVTDEFDEDADDDVGDSEGFRREEVFKNLSYLCCNDVGNDENDQRSPFQHLESKMENVTEDGGVKKMLLQPGSGNRVPENSLVIVHYNAYLEYSDEPYDSSRLRNRKSKFRLGEMKPGMGYSGEAIPGMSLAVSTMKKGELSRFLIKPEYGYGHLGCAPRIPPNATLMHEIELLNFVEGQNIGVEDYFHLTREERQAIPWEKIKSACDAAKKEARILFEDEGYYKAQLKYRKAICVLEDYHMRDEEQEKQQQKMLLKLYLNISVCYLKQCKSRQTLIYANKALEIDERNVKALYNKGKALLRMGEFGQSRKSLVAAHNLNRKNEEIKAALKELECKAKEFKEIESKQCQRMISNLSPAAARGESTQQKSKSSSKSQEDFKTAVRKHLMEMKNNPGNEVMPFPNWSLGPVEIANIIETAEELDLDVIQQGEAPHVKYFLRKKNPK